MIRDYGSRIEIEGLEEVQKKIDKLPEVVRKRAVELLDRNILLAAQEYTISNYLSGPRPFVLDRISGNLARSIGHTVRSEGSEIFNLSYGTVNYNQVGKPRLSSIEFGSVMEYASKHEFGQGVPARPFVRPTVEKFIIPRFLREFERVNLE